MSADNSLLSFGGDNSATDFSGGDSGSSSSFLGSNANTIATAAKGALGAAGSLIAGQGTAAGDTTAAAGYASEAKLYEQAAAEAGIDIGLVQAGGKIQATQLQRQIEMTEGTATADFGQGNVVNSPTMADVLAESSRQGQLAIGQQNLQTNIEANQFEQMQLGYNAQAQGAVGEEQAAQNAAKQASGGGILGALGQIVQIAGVVAAPFTGGASLIASAAVGAAGAASGGKI